MVQWTNLWAFTDGEMAHAQEKFARRNFSDSNVMLSGSVLSHILACAFSQRNFFGLLFLQIADICITQ